VARAPKATAIDDAIWRVQRLLTLQRDAHQCMVRGPGCLIEADDVIQVLPTALGGSDQIDNLQSACNRCIRTAGMPD
jgi:5-methylcytosine-specific restriction endonuclease McrA